MNGDIPKALESVSAALVQEAELPLVVKAETPETSETSEKRKVNDISGEEYTLIIKPNFRAEIIAQEKPVKKVKGQNKAKERHGSSGVDLVKLCFAIANGEECQKENCKFSHDVEEYLKSKGEDIGPECPNLLAFGSCKFGIKCRFLKSHDDPKLQIKPSVISETKNVVSRDLQKQIRSGKLNLVKSSEFKTYWLSHTEKLENQTVDLAKLRPAEKKRIDFRGKSYLAPLTTVGNIPFRRICKQFGVDITCAEMALAQNLLAGSQTEWALLKRHSSEDLFGVQVTGNDPVTFAKLCDVLNQSIETDFVDLNLGCPVDAITSKGCGSALMERKNKLRGMVMGADYVLDVPVTVKLRTGVKEDKPFAHKLIPLFQEWGAAAVTLHGRSKTQRYSKLANWDYIVQCSKTINRTETNHTAFFGNGDVFNPNDISLLQKHQELDGVMIGRGALIKPWIFQELKSGQLYDISSNERLDILKDFAKFGMEHWGTDTMGINQTRRFMCEWLSFLHRYVPVGLIEVLPQKMNLRPHRYFGRNELETLMASDQVNDWIKLSEMVLGPASDSFSFIPKHKSSAISTEG